MRAPDTVFMEALTGEVESASTQLFALWPTVRGFATSLHLNLADACHRPGAVALHRGTSGMRSIPQARSLTTTSV